MSLALQLVQPVQDKPVPLPVVLGAYNAMLLAAKMLPAPGSLSRKGNPH
jgi:hypothetical protein